MPYEMSCRLLEWQFPVDLAFRRWHLHHLKVTGWMLRKGDPDIDNH
jgi:hypothetical protein